MRLPRPTRNIAVPVITNASRPTRKTSNLKTFVSNGRRRQVEEVFTGPRHKVKVSRDKTEVIKGQVAITRGSVVLSLYCFMSINFKEHKASATEKNNFRFLFLIFFPFQSRIIRRKALNSCLVLFRFA